MTSPPVSIPAPWLSAAMDLVIFDCDGVLVDSEPLSATVMAAYLAEIGYPLDAETCIDRFTGLSLSSIAGILDGEGPRALPSDFIATLQARDRIAFDAYLRPIEGAGELLLALTTKRCVASSGSIEKIRHNLMITGLLPFFDPNLFSAAMVDRGKPEPDLFLLAAERMGASIDRTVVIEDSVAGVRAARAAGMTVIGFVGGGHCRPSTSVRLAEAGAHAIFGRMADISACLTAVPGPAPAADVVPFSEA